MSSVHVIATLVIRFYQGVPSVYVDAPLDLDVVVDASDDYKQGMADTAFYSLDTEINPELVSHAVREAEQAV